MSQTQHVTGVTSPIIVVYIISYVSIQYVMCAYYSLLFVVHTKHVVSSKQSHVTNGGSARLRTTGWGLSTFMFSSVCVYIYTYIYIHIHIHIHTTKYKLYNILVMLRLYIYHIITLI